ncbi:MAG: glycine cleavage system aminomethyltransferase GcvT [Deltaproteobacteria bacterium]|nr:glycine cleavage system aminomethyltransferase GcvT [Deltaproteobacteria bacterium]
MSLKKLPLHNVHARLGARFVEFAGYHMPVQYSSLIDEHLTVRSSAGLFDISHMGWIMVEGKGAGSWLQRLTTNDIGQIGDTGCQYSFICNANGGIKDDVIVYRRSACLFYVCVNSVNTDKILKWMAENAMEGVDVRSPEVAILALQGPLSERILSPLCKGKIETLRRYCFIETSVMDVDVILSRTGYTGEDGFEIFFPREHAERIWNGILEKGSVLGINPAGLGARDTLRIEMGYPLYGHELDEETTPFEAGLERFVSLEKDDFIGKTALMGRQLNKKLVGIEMVQAGIARSGYRILSDGRVVGHVTSGTYGPSVKKAIGMGYVAPSSAERDCELDIEIRKTRARAIVRDMPFYKRLMLNQ